MPPKGAKKDPKPKSAAAKRKQSASATPQAAQPASVPESLFAAHHLEEQVKAAKRKKKSVAGPLDVVVKKCIFDNLKNFSDEEIYEHKVDGITCFEKILKDKNKQRDDPECTIVFGKVYYNEIRCLFQLGRGNADGLDVQDESLPCSPALLEAVRKSRAANAQRDALIEWLKTAPKCNQTELVGLLSHLLELKPWLGGMQFQVLIEAIRYIVRHNLEIDMADEVNFFKKQADRTLTFAWTSMKSKGFDPTIFWDGYRSLAHLVLPVLAVDRIMAVKDSWSKHQSDLEVVVESELGSSMFDYAISVNASDRVGDFIEEFVGKQFHGKEVTQTLYNDTQKLLLAETKKLPYRTSLNVPRVVKLAYRGVEFKITAKTVFDEISLRLDCYARNVGITYVPDGKTEPTLVPLFCEASLLPIVKQSTQKIELSVLAAANVARKTANAALSEERRTQGTRVQECLQTNEDVFNMLDASFRIEVCFFNAMHTYGAQKALQDIALNALPQAAGDKADIVGIAQHFDGFKMKPIYRFCTDQAQSSINVACSWLHALANLREPSLKVADSSTFLTEVASRLPYFCRVDIAALDDEPARTVVGKEALAHMLQRVDERVTAALPLSMDDLRLLSSFHWLLSQDQQLRIKTHVNSLYKNAGASVVSSSSASSSSSGLPPKPAKKATAAKPAPLVDSTLKLFLKKK